MDERKEAGHAQDENEILFSQLLHDFKNQLGGLKLYAALLKKNLQRDSLDVQEGIEICERLINTIDAMTVRTKEAGRLVRAHVNHSE